jgi:hypothetical protein
MADLPRTADESPPPELWQASMRLLLALVVLALLVVPIIRELPLGQTTRTSVLAWLLVAMGLYWLYAGLGYRVLLLTQLALFSVAAALLSVKLVLVGIGVHRLSVLRRTAKVLILLGAGCAGVNVAAMLITGFRRGLPRAPAA